MTLEEAKKSIRKDEWYRQGAAVKPLYIGYPWRTCLYFTVNRKPVAMHYPEFAVYYKKNYFDVYFRRAPMRKIAGYYQGKQKNNPKFIQGLKSNWERIYAKALLKALKACEKTDLGRLSERDLLDEFKKFSVIYEHLWKEAIFLDAFDVMSDSILDQEVKKHHIAPTPQILQVLTTPTELSWLQKERLELLSIADQVRKRHKADIQKLLSKHADKYHWIYNNYAVIKRLDAGFFQKEIDKLLKNPNEYRREMRRLIQIRKLRLKRRKLIRKLRLPQDFIRTIDFIVFLASWRDSRKAYSQMAGDVILRFVREFARRLKISRAQAEEFFWPEIFSVFKSREPDLKFIQTRAQGTFFIYDQRKREHFFTGIKARRLHEFVNSLISNKEECTGRPVYGGIARGRAKLILTQKDFQKFKKGDILIASNTRPEYVPIMKLASAIVTEEGGLTSHAAIVSRELRKPCVVGVQGVLSAIKDNDFLEVDAYEGHVKKFN